MVLGKVNGQWRAMVAFFDMLAYLLAIVVSGNRFLRELLFCSNFCFHTDPQDFYILTTVSAIMIFLAAITFIATVPSGVK